MEKFLHPLTKENLESVYQLYEKNEDFFNITLTDFENQTLKDMAFEENLSLVCYSTEIKEPIAVIIGVIKKGYIKRNLIIKVFLVDKAFRRKGIGTWMFNELIDRAKPSLKLFSSVIYGFSPPQFLQPGVDVRHTSLLYFLKSKGLKRRGTRHNLTVHIPEDFPEPKTEYAGYVFQRVTPEYFDKTLEFIKKAFIAPTWPSEAKLTFRPEKPTTFIALDLDKNVVGFASHSTCFTSSFGPTGVLKTLRGKNIGGELLKWCIWDIKSLGLDTVTIMYVVGDTVKYYVKTVGAYIHPVHIPMSRWIYGLRSELRKTEVSRKGKSEIAYCPNCFHKLDFANNTSGWLNSETYFCPSCKYSGSFYVTKDTDTEENND